MKLFVDPTPITSVDLTESEMAGISAGQVAAAIPAFVAAVVKCGSSFGAVVIAIVDILEPQ